MYIPNHMPNHHDKPSDRKKRDTDTHGKPSWCFILWLSNYARYPNTTWQGTFFCKLVRGSKYLLYVWMALEQFDWIHWYYHETWRIASTLQWPFISIRSKRPWYYWAPFFGWCLWFYCRKQYSSLKCNILGSFFLFPKRRNSMVQTFVPHKGR